MSDPALPPLSLEEMVGQVILAVWPPADAAALEEMVALDRVGGLWLAPEASVSAVDLSRHLNALQRLASYPLLVAADPVLGPLSLAPPEIALGAARQPELARAVGKAVARRARACGIHLLLAPALDVQREPNHGLGAWRSFGENPSLTAHLGVAWIEGCMAGGALAAACAFPGGGSAIYDAERRLASLPQSRTDLEKVDLAPFTAAIAAGVPALATGHWHVAALDSLPTRLATHSSAVVEGLLRHTLGFRGLLLTGCLDDPAVAIRYGSAQAAVLAFAAGHDLLVTTHPAEAYRALYTVLLHGDVPRSRLEEAVARIWTARRSLGLFQRRLVEPTGAELAGGEQEMAASARASLTRVYGRREVVAGRRLLVLASAAGDGPFVTLVQRLARGRLASVGFVPLAVEPGVPEVEKALAAAAGAEAALLFAWLPPARLGEAVPGAALGRLAAALHQTLPVAVAVAGDPYALAHYAGAADLLLYLPLGGAAWLEAACDYLLGQTDAPGRLPVAVKGSDVTARSWGWA